MLIFWTLALGSVFSLCAQNSLIKGYNDKKPGTEFTYTFLSAVFALIICIVIAMAGSGICFNNDSFLYSVLFALFYAGSTVTFVLAVGCGSLALTATIHSFALIIPILTGLVFWDEKITPVKIAGIVFLIVSLLFVAEKGTSSDKKISPRWISLMCVSFLCEGLAPVTLTAHKKVVGEEIANRCESTVLAIAYAIAVVGLFVAAFVKEGKEKNAGENVKAKSVFLSNLKIALPFAAIAGACNGLYNYMYSVASGKFDVSKFVPIVSAGQVVLTALISVLFFKEKLSKKQYAALCFGVVAIALLNM